VWQVPEVFLLLQNFPNPFNPSTTISYSIPVGTRHAVSLQVFDVLGRKVATLVNEEKDAGNYSVAWNAASAASGVYYYKLTSGAFTETKKMILMK
jgi:hypothetical protein